jgi:hypothetical protein
MMPEHMNQNGADLDNATVEAMVECGVKCAQMSQFFYEGLSFVRAAPAVVITEDRQRRSNL